jgi:hypothetical protein
MNEPMRLTDGSRQPSDAAVAEFIGKRNAARWADLAEFIAAAYPATFNIEWLFGGRKHGWYLRYKKSKSFCTFIPERERFLVLLIFGAAERNKVGPMLPELASHVQEDYLQATTYQDGKWVLINVDSAKVLSDVKKLLAVKRRPKIGVHATA